MKTLLLHTLIFLICFTPLLSYANSCPPATPNMVTQTQSGNFQVNPPEGYTYMGAGYDISKTGPIILADTMLTSHTLPPPDQITGPYEKINATDIICKYGIDESTPGTYPGGIFMIHKDISFQTNLDSSWYYMRESGFVCYENSNNSCSF
jgi:hypothetical protein